MAKNKNQTKAIEICQWNQIPDTSKKQTFQSRSVSNGFILRIKQGVKKPCVNTVRFPILEG